MEEDTILQPLFHALDPVSLLLAPNASHSDEAVPPRLATTTTDTFFYALERGPRYREYAELRKSKLRRTSQPEQDKDCDFRQTPPRKQVKFRTCHLGTRKGGTFCGVVAQSVPGFSATLRKENRKPGLTWELTLTPPPPPLPASGSKYWSNVSGVLSGSRGSKSANSAGEKKWRNGNVGIIARKSYANLEELRGFAINEESRNGKTVVGIGTFDFLFLMIVSVYFGHGYVGLKRILFFSSLILLYSFLSWNWFIGLPQFQRFECSINQ